MAPEEPSAFDIVLDVFKAALLQDLDTVGLNLTKQLESRFKAALIQDVDKTAWPDFVCVISGTGTLAKNHLKQHLSENLWNAASIAHLSDEKKFKVERFMFQNVEALPESLGTWVLSEVGEVEEMKPEDFLPFVLKEAPSQQPDLKKVFEKNAQHLTENDIALILELSREKTSGSGESGWDYASIAAGLLALKEENPEQFEYVMKLEKSLALGLKGSGVGPTTTKHTSAPYFPSR